MTAFNQAVLHPWHIAKNLDSQLFLNQFFHPWIQHGRHLVKDHAFNVAILFIFQKPFDIGNQRNTHSFAVYDQDHRSIRNICQIISTGFRGRACHSVIISHNAFHNSQITVLCVFLKQISGNIWRCKKGVKISGFGTDHLAVEHGINIIRPAFKGSCSDPSVYKHL